MDDGAGSGSNRFVRGCHCVGLIVSRNAITYVKNLPPACEDVFKHDGVSKMKSPIFSKGVGNLKNN